MPSFSVKFYLYGRLLLTESISATRGSGDSHHSRLTVSRARVLPSSRADSFCVLSSIDRVRRRCRPAIYSRFRPHVVIATGQSHPDGRARRIGFHRAVWPGRGAAALCATRGRAAATASSSLGADRRRALSPLTRVRALRAALPTISIAVARPSRARLEFPSRVWSSFLKKFSARTVG